MGKSRTSLKSYEYNAICDSCGFKFKNTELKMRWDGFMVCKDDWETRNIADFYQTPDDNHKLPWTRPDNNNGNSWTLSGIGFVVSGSVIQSSTYTVDTTNRIVTFQVVIGATGYITSNGSCTVNTPTGYTPAANVVAGVCTSQGKNLGTISVTTGQTITVPAFTQLTTPFILSGKYGY